MSRPRDSPDWPGQRAPQDAVDAAPLPLVITDVQFTPASAYHRHSGLLGYLRCVVNGALAIDGITLRRTYVGDLILSFPERRSKDGKKHPIVYPRSQEARDEIERQIMAELRRQGELR